MKILIAGFGSIGRRHFRNLLSLGEQDIVFYRTHQSTLPDEELAGFKVENDLDIALAHQPDAAIICNPTALHLDVAVPAARAGCHLFLEKPISHTMEAVGELVSAVEHGDGRVLVGYQFRFHPALQQIKRLLDGGAIGQPLSARTHWGEYLPGWHPWEDYRQGYSARSDLGGGVILTLSHPIDYMHWLLGEVTDVWSFSDQVSALELEVEGIAEIGLRFESGAIGSVHLDYIQRPPVHHLEIIGDRGTIQWDYKDGNIRLFRVGYTKDGEWETIPTTSDFQRNDMFRTQMEHFLEVAKGSTISRCTLEDGIRALQISLAANQSNALKMIIQPQKMVL